MCCTSACLVLDEGDERGDAHGDAAAQDGGQLVHQALACRASRYALFGLWRAGL